MDDHPSFRELGGPHDPIEFHEVRPALDALLRALGYFVIWLTAIAVAAAIPIVIWLWRWAL